MSARAKTMPAASAHALTAERAMLGACLQIPRAAEAVLVAVADEDCFEIRHQKILRAIRAAVGKGERADLVTVARALEARHELRTVGGASYLTELVDLDCPMSSNYAAYITAVTETAKRRRVIAACQRTIDDLRDPANSLPEHAGQLLEDVDHYVNGQGDAGVPLLPVKLETVLSAWRRDSEDGRQPPRIKTSIPKLNACLGGGFEPGDLVYLGARPAVGKTALALEIARRAAQDGTGVLLISREMAILRLVRRILAQASRIPAATIKTGLFSDQEYPILVQAYDALAGLPVWLCDQAISLADIVRMVERWSFTPALGLVVVDYLQLVRAPKEIRDRRLQVEAVSQGLKTMAMTCQLPVLCLSSLSRPEKGGADRKPTLADLRESGELEHDADVVLFLHRGFGQEETTLIVAKNRDGRVGEMTLRFRPEYVAFDTASEGNA